MTNEITMINLNDLSEHPEQIKIYGQITENPEMTASIRKNGVLQPLRVCLPLKNDPLMTAENFTIISGHRRKFHAELAGLTEIPAIVEYYESYNDTVEHLIESNCRNRERTRQQIANEIKTLKQILCHKPKKGRKSKHSGDVESGEINGVACNMENETETERKLIAQNVGISENSTKQIDAITGDVYRKSFVEKYDKAMIKAAIDDEQRENNIISLDQQWDDISTAFVTSQLSERAAYEAVLGLQKAAIDDVHTSINTDETDAKDFAPKESKKNTEKVKLFEKYDPVYDAADGNLHYLNNALAVLFVAENPTMLIFRKGKKEYKINLDELTSLLKLQK